MSLKLKRIAFTIILHSSFNIIASQSPKKLFENLQIRVTKARGCDATLTKCPFSGNMQLQYSKKDHNDVTQKTVIVTHHPQTNTYSKKVFYANENTSIIRRRLSDQYKRIKEITNLQLNEYGSKITTSETCVVFKKSTF